MVDTFPVIASTPRCRADMVDDRVLPDAVAAALPAQPVRELEEHVAAPEGADRASAEMRRSAEQALFRLTEVEHHLMNGFAAIHALAAQIVPPGDAGDAFRTTFEARLLALARSHELLVSGRSEGASLNEMVVRCLRPYEDAAGRVSVLGPVVHLPARDVPTLGLAFHELATNAVRYGALSVPGGRVTVTWQLQADAGNQTSPVSIAWRERGGPPVVTPKRRGFGSRLLECGIAQGLGGSARINFAFQGVDCRICLPLARA